MCIFNCGGNIKDDGHLESVWAVLKPGILALLKDLFDTKPLDIIVFDVLPASDGNGEGRVSLATEINDQNPLHHSFKLMSQCQNTCDKVGTNLNKVTCDLLHWEGTCEVVTEGTVASKDPKDNVHDVSLGTLCWKMWVDILTF